MQLDDILLDIMNELDKAIEKHPVWPVDKIHNAAIVAEETGELVQACLKFLYENGPYENMRMEAVHVAVTAIRFLLAMR